MTRRIALYVFIIHSVINFAATARAQQIFTLGIAQDAGYPHIGCQKECCTVARRHEPLDVYVVSFALMDTVEKKWWLFEATPDISKQLELFHRRTHKEYSYLPQGIFITHAHIGHYTGLMYLGREALGAKAVPVYTLPVMAEYLRTNGPWSQLVSLNNISLSPLSTKHPIELTPRIAVSAFTVPHRDEYSETAGFRIQAGDNKVLFIPDIDKWEKWEKSIVKEVKSVDIALLDATFYSANELPGRDMKEIPHPLVTETMALFENEPSDEKRKIHFIHFNHTNPLLSNPDVMGQVTESGFRICLMARFLLPAK